MSTRFLTLVGACIAMTIAVVGSAQAIPLNPADTARAIDAANTASVTVERVHERRYHRKHRYGRGHYRRYHGGYGYRRGYGYNYNGIYIGRALPSGRYGCRYRYSGYFTDHPCWARRALSPPRYR